MVVCFAGVRLPTCSLGQLREPRIVVAAVILPSSKGVAPAAARMRGERVIRVPPACRPLRLLANLMLDAL